MTETTTMGTSSGLTAAIAIQMLKQKLADYNYWGQSESDSPLAVKRTKSALDDKKILSLDASMRRKAMATEGYKPPERTIRSSGLEETIKPLFMNQITELWNLTTPVNEGTAGIETLESSLEATEYYVQVYNAFRMLGQPRVCYVEDTAATDPYTGLFIIGQSSDGETVYAQSLLVQT
jgi:hypothetical protein